MLAKKYLSEVVSVKNEIDGIFTLEFKSLGRKFKYSPGQFLHLAIDVDYDGSGQWPDSRCFSMHSNPEEENIRITYSVKGSFTKQMSELIGIGTKVWLKLPYGELFTNYHDKDKSIFIAGGTGITPFLSLFNHSSFNKYENPKIYIGFKSTEYNFYSNDLLKVKDFITIVYEDNEGHININEVCGSNSKDAFYFLSGPQEMIEYFSKEIVENGIPAENIITDEWI